MKQLPQAPRYLSRGEVAANRIQAAVRRRFTRVQNRAKLQTEVSQQFPFVVYLSPERHLHIDRFAIRQWFVSQLRSEAVHSCAKSCKITDRSLTTVPVCGLFGT